MEAIIPGLSISGIATAIPTKKLNHKDQFSVFGQAEVTRIVASIGIEEVRVAGDLKASDLCIAAAENLIEKLAIDKNSIDAIIFISQTPDYVMPATSAVIQHKLGLKKEIATFDINYGCSGYVYGLYQASMLIAAGGASKVLLLTGDTITNYLNPTDRQVKLVFGDAGSATLIEKGNDAFSFILKSDGAGSDVLKIDTQNSFLQMDGSQVMTFALREVPQIIHELLVLQNWKKTDVAKYYLHQANLFMLNHLRKMLRLDRSVVPIAVKNVGNTGPTSIPLTLSLTETGINPLLNKVVLCGFGVGLSWAAAGVTLSNANILAPIEIEKHFKHEGRVDES